MKEAAKSRARKSQVDNALAIADKKRVKIAKLQMFDLNCFNSRRSFGNDGLLLNNNLVI